jgi:hypothetical protein
MHRADSEVKSPVKCITFGTARSSGNNVARRIAVHITTGLDDSSSGFIDI